MSTTNWEPEFGKIMRNIFGRDWKSLYRPETLNAYYKVFEMSVDHGLEIGKRMAGTKPNLDPAVGAKPGRRQR